ncbi:hypothetical protein ACS77_09680 [Pseudomonas syringae]|uniref:Uncharacterized protein n=1 Tax=Pseudomonas syringae TaxID=317 RepID=A0A0L1MI78_PSESX|nr:hypothetical protein ACS77_09680 [Pseudomonas syringae]
MGAGILQERTVQQVKWCPNFTSDQYYCGLGVVKKVGTQESVQGVPAAAAWGKQTILMLPKSAKQERVIPGSVA